MINNIVDVLLVEDDEVDAEMVRKCLENIPVKSGQEPTVINLVHFRYMQHALDHLENNKPVNVVLLDMNLPDGQGSELIDTLKKKRSDLPIIIITGTGHRGDKVLELLHHGAEDFIPKDGISQNRLVETILYVVERQRLRSGA